MVMSTYVNFNGVCAEALPMRSAYLSLNPGTPEEAQRIFAALPDGGEVFMPVRETFFATRSPSCGTASASTG